MTYQEFNKAILEYFISRSSTTFFTLSLDSYEIEKIIPLSKISEFYLLKTSWNRLLDSKEGVPQYFGLLAIQCYAASLMHEDESNAADAYQVRLCEILKLENTNLLQNLFKGEDIANPIQEEIWHNAKHYFKTNLNQELEIPEKKFCAGRYVQYPKSQALLTTEDLRHFTVFFAEYFQINEEFSFDYFKTLLNNRYHFIDKTSRIIKLWNDEGKRERCIKQVYDYYNFWDGEIYATSNKKTNRGIIKHQIKKADTVKLILLYKEGEARFFTTTQDGVEINQVPTQNLLQLKDYKYIHKNLMIFNEFEYYPGEYEDSRFLYNSVKSFILLDCNFRQQEHYYLEKNHEIKLELSSNLIVYKCSFETIIKNSPLNSFIQYNRPVFLKGGIKINRKNDYLKGYGPTIIADQQFDVIYEFNKCKYNREFADVGLYKIRTDNFKDFEFCILERTEPCTTVQSKGRGWNLKSFFVEDTYDIEGYTIQLASVVKITPIRKWINANIKIKKIDYENETSIINKALYNSKK